MPNSEVGVRSSGDTIPNSEGSKDERWQPPILENAESTSNRGKPTIVSSVFHVGLPPSVRRASGLPKGTLLFSDVVYAR